MRSERRGWEGYLVLGRAEDGVRRWHALFVLTQVPVVEQRFANELPGRLAVLVDEDIADADVPMKDPSLLPCVPVACMKRFST